MKYFITNNVQLFNTYDRVTVCDLQFCLNYFADKPIIGLDTETEGLDVYTKVLLLLQLGDFENQFAIDFTINIELLKPLLEDSSKLFILHNAKFDLQFLYHKRIVIRNIYDTFVVEKLLYMGYPPGKRSMSLQGCAGNYLGIYLDKSERGNIKRALTQEVIEYGCNDVKYLNQIMDAQAVELTEKNLHFAAKVENEFVKVLAYIEYSGIKLDVDKWKEKMDNDSRKLEASRLVLNKWVVDNSKIDSRLLKFTEINLQGDLFDGFNSEPVCNINWASSPQVVKLFEILGFKLLTKDKKTGLMKKSVEAKVISLQKDVSSITQPYLDYKGYDKVVSTYGQGVIDQINPVSGRIHTNFNQMMDTGRLSCGGKDKTNNIEHLNLQNLPNNDETRHSFIAQPGYTLIDCDYTAQEDFIFAELSQEKKLIEFYNDTRKRDGHSFVAKICFPKDLDNLSEEEVKHKRPDLRTLAKKAKFSIHYGGNGSTIARNLSLPLDDGNAIEKSYLTGLPNIEIYFKKVKKDMWNKGYILINGITGHKMFIHNWKELKDIERSMDSEYWNKYREIKNQWIENGSNRDDRPQMMLDVSKFFQTKSGYERNALNAPVQGTAAIITKIAGIRFFNYLLRSNLLFIVWIPNDVHDEYLVESPDEIVDEVAANLKKSMDDAAALFCKSVKLVAVPETAKYWIH